MANIWYTLFSILTGVYHAGLRESTNSLSISSAYAYNLQFNYRIVIWNELVEVVTEKFKLRKVRKFIPYPRFLAMLIISVMR